MQRQEIVGYRSPLNLKLAHVKTITSTITLTMQSCRLVFGMLDNPAFDRVFYASSVIAMMLMFDNITNRFGAWDLASLGEHAARIANPALQDNRDGRFDMGRVDVIRRQLPVSQIPMCLFSSLNAAKKPFHSTMLGSVFAGVVMIKALDLFLNEGLSPSSMLHLSLTIVLLNMLLFDFKFAQNKHFGATVVSAERVLAMAGPL